MAWSILADLERIIVLDPMVSIGTGLALARLQGLDSPNCAPYTRWSAVLRLVLKSVSIEPIDTPTPPGSLVSSQPGLSLAIQCVLHQTEQAQTAAVLESASWPILP